MSNITFYAFSTKAHDGDVPAIGEMRGSPDVLLFEEVVNHHALSLRQWYAR